LSPKENSMDYDNFNRTVYLEGPDEIRPVLRALGDPSAHGRVYEVDELIEITAEEAVIASNVLFDRSWAATVSVEEGQRMRDLADSVGVMAMRAREKTLPLADSNS
jgi:hypothetical protein